MATCKNCEDMQIPAEGTGPVRAKFNQPTMYDHMEHYCKFKHRKERAQKFQCTKEKLLQVNNRFTNYKPITTNVEELLQQFSTQSMVKFKEMFKSNEDCNIVDEEAANEHNHQPTKSTESLINISRSPINCPVDSCKRTIGITSVLSHFLKDHKQFFPVDFQDIEGNKRSVLAFDENIFPLNENICLGILAYGGKYGTESTRPGLVGLCRGNSFLPEKYINFLNHLPILIMGAKKNLTALFSNKQLALKYYNQNDPSKDIIVLWLATVETTKKIHCTLTAFDQEMTSSRSTIIEVRNLKYIQNPEIFLITDPNCLMLSRGELNILSNNGRSPFELEIFIHEFDE